MQLPQKIDLKSSRKLSLLSLIETRSLSNLKLEENIFTSVFVNPVRVQSPFTNEKMSPYNVNSDVDCTLNFPRALYHLRF